MTGLEHAEAAEVVASGISADQATLTRGLIHATLANTAAILAAAGLVEFGEPGNGE